MRTTLRLSVALGLLAVVAAGLVGAACALNKEGLGPADAAATDGPSVEAPGDDTVSPEASDDGPSTSDADANVVSAQCLAGCTMEGGICEGDGGSQCSVYCTGTNQCTSVRCPPGIPCYVDCTAPGSCSGGVDCADASSCTVSCGGASNCGNVTCGGSDCTVLCGVPGACANTIDCIATNSCTVECTAPNCCAGAIHSAAQNTTVDCYPPGTCGKIITCGGQQCGVGCGADGSCGSGECCDAGTCNPRAPQNCP
jgi:hypothetical protein